MEEHYLQFLICSNCQNTNLQLKNCLMYLGKIIEGDLSCDACHSTYKIVGGIPAFQHEFRDHSAEDNARVIRYAFRKQILRFLIKLIFKKSSQDIRYLIDAEEQTFEKRTDTFQQLPHSVQNILIESEGPILEIGCGNGGGVLGIVDTVSVPVIGIEVDKNRADMAYGNLKGKNCCILRGSGESLPLRSESIQTIVLIEVVEHVVDYQLLFSEMHRVLRPNGRVYLSFPSINSISGPHLMHLIPLPFAQLLFGLEELRAVALEEIRKADSSVAGLDHLNSMTINKLLYVATPLFSLQWLRVYCKYMPLKILQMLPWIDDYAGDSVRVILRKCDGSDMQSRTWIYLQQKYRQFVEALP